MQASEEDERKYLDFKSSGFVMDVSPLDGGVHLSFSYDASGIDWIGDAISGMMRKGKFIFMINKYEFIRYVHREERHHQLINSDQPFPSVDDQISPGFIYPKTYVTLRCGVSNATG